MAFKNAFKNLVAHFGVVWALLLYIIMFAALITGLSLPFIMPIARAFGAAGVFSQIKDGFSALFGGSGGLKGLWDGFYGAYLSIRDVFMSDTRVASLTMAFLIIIVIIVFRFFLGLYEIPIATVIAGRMSCNASYGLGGKFFSTFWLSVRYSFFKMIYTTAFDIVISLAIYGLTNAVGAGMALPFLIVLVTMAFMALRFSICACWAPIVASGERGVIKGFLYSAKICFKRFGSIYSTYFITLLLMLAIGLFITLFTLGVGLIIILPMFATYISYLNATEFYTKTGKRYYVESAVITPPIENVL